MNWHDYTKLLTRLVKLSYNTNNIRYTRQLKSNGTYSLINESLCFKDLEITAPYKHTPIYTKKRLYPEKAYGELLWLLDGSRDFEILHKYGVHWWDSYKPLGPIYGVQLYKNNQLIRLFNSMIRAPFSRRHIISFWNTADLDNMSLPPCYHTLQFLFSTNQKALNLIVSQRSADVFIGLPYDIVVMQMFLRLMAWLFDCKAEALYFNIGDAHLYKEHLEAAKKCLAFNPSRHKTHRLDFKEPPLDYRNGKNLMDLLINLHKLNEPVFDWSSYPLSKIPPFPVEVFF